MDADMLDRCRLVATHTCPLFLGIGLACAWCGVVGLGLYIATYRRRCCCDDLLESSNHPSPTWPIAPSDCRHVCTCARPSRRGMMWSACIDLLLGGLWRGGGEAVVTRLSGDLVDCNSCEN